MHTYLWTHANVLPTPHSLCLTCARRPFIFCWSEHGNTRSTISLPEANDISLHSPHYGPAAVDQCDQWTVTLSLKGEAYTDANVPALMLLLGHCVWPTVCKTQISIYFHQKWRKSSHSWRQDQRVVTFLLVKSLKNNKQTNNIYLELDSWFQHYLRRQFYV